MAHTHANTLRRGAALIGAGALLLTATTLPLNSAAAAAPAGWRTISGMVVDAVSHMPVPDACVYPFYGSAAPTAPTKAPFRLAQVLTPGCSNSSGRYKISVPPDRLSDLPVRALVVSPTPVLVSQVLDLPAGSGTADLALPTSLANVSGKVTYGGTAWKGAIAVVYDAGTDDAYGYAHVDSKGLFRVGVALPEAAKIRVDFIGSPGTMFVNSLTPKEFPATPTVNTIVGTSSIPTAARVTGRVTTDGHKAVPQYVVAATCSQPKCISALAVTDVNGSFTFLLPRKQLRTISYGASTVSRSFTAASTTLTAARTAAAGHRPPVRGTAPQTWLDSSPSVTLLPTMRVSWSGGSADSAPIGWQTHHVTADWHTALAPYPDWVTSGPRSYSAPLVPGTAVCVQARTVTFFSPLHASYLGAIGTRCVASPLDERNLNRTAGWHKVASATAYHASLLRSSVAHATLSLTGVYGRQLAIVYAKASNGGAFTVAVNGATVKTVQTRGGAGGQQIVYLPGRSMTGATVTITATSKAPVAIDGLAVIP